MTERAGTDGFRVVVAPAPPREAAVRFEAWLAAQGIERTAIDPTDIRVDEIRATGCATLHRYAVRTVRPTDS